MSEWMSAINRSSNQLSMAQDTCKQTEYLLLKLASALRVRKCWTMDSSSPVITQLQFIIQYRCCGYPGTVCGNSNCAMD